MGALILLKKKLESLALSIIPRSHSHPRIKKPLPLDKLLISSSLKDSQLSFWASATCDENYFTEHEKSYYSKWLACPIRNSSQCQNLNLDCSGKAIVWLPGEILGQGSFGVVVLGLNEETGQIMAVKQCRMPVKKSLVKK